MHDLKCEQRADRADKAHKDQTKHIEQTKPETNEIDTPEETDKADRASRSKNLDGSRVEARTWTEAAGSEQHAHRSDIRMHTKQEYGSQKVSILINVFLNPLCTDTFFVSILW